MLPLNTTTEILTVAEARRRLDGGVRELVGDMMLVAAALEDAHRELDAIEEGQEEALEGAEREVETLENRLRGIVAVLNEQGAVVKDPLRGLIDFYGWQDGEMVFLCWLHGEKTIDHWHGIESGFAGRRPIEDDAGN